MARNKKSKSYQSPQKNNNKQSQQQSQDSNASSTPGGGGVSNSEETINTETILANLSKASDLESQLDAIITEQKSNPKRKLSPASEEKNQALRLQLCSVLSDVILVDCVLADTNDAINRLWKICFYNRINELRSRITKEKSRAKKRQVAGGAGSSDAIETSKKMVLSLEYQLGTFLNEAIELYKYIIERYVKELMPLSQTQSQLSTQSSDEEQQRSLVVISSLYRLNIHLGDLYRYSTQYKNAEECYLHATQLAPSTGNPYNQLAVVAQQQSPNEMTCVALYYYARSLMATKYPFDTSRSNLVRLFESNHKWMEEHLRDDESTRRGGNMSTGSSGGGSKDKVIVGMSKKEQKEWQNKERTANNRMALVKLVDLQWSFFKGVSLDMGENDTTDKEEDDKIDLDTLITKMYTLQETLTTLIGQASFSESLLCKLMSILAFTTLGTSNGGKPINVEGFDAKRIKKPRFNEGIIMTNQALAFSFLLRFVGILAKDVEMVIRKKTSAAGGGGGSNINNKLGAIRSLPSLLLGFRFVTSIYEGDCEWFHGLPFFPSSDGDNVVGNELSSSSIHDLCKESHVEFWKSIASLANQLDDALPKKQQKGSEDVEFADIKEFNDFHGYVPFSSFLDKDDDLLVKDGKTTEYVTVNDAISALANTKQSGNKGGEAAIKMKINLFVSIADGMTSDDTGGDGKCFLTRNPETNKREFVMSSTSNEDSDTEEQHETSFSPNQSPSITADMDTEDDDEKGTAEEVVQDHDIPLKMSHPEKGGMALLTPAALLAGAGGSNNEAKESSTLAPIESFLAPSTIKEPHKNPQTVAAATTIGVDSLLNNSFLPMQQEQPKKAPLPPPPGLSPPPGFSMQPQQQLAPAPITTGISLADFTDPVQAQQPNNSLPFGTTHQATFNGLMPMPPQAGASHPTTNMFDTMNPFAQASLPTFNNNAYIPANTSLLNQPPGFSLNNTSQNVNINQQQQSNSGGLDPTLDFLLGSNRNQSADDLASSNAFNLLMPSSVAQPDDQSGESLMNFLFDSNNGDTSRGNRQPLYASHNSQTQQGVPPTKNPFAT